MSRTHCDFNAMWNRIATHRARIEKEQREREIVESAAEQERINDECEASTPQVQCVSASL